MVHVSKYHHNDIILQRTPEYLPLSSQFTVHSSHILLISQFPQTVCTLLVVNRSKPARLPLISSDDEWTHRTQNHKEITTEHTKLSFVAS